jgi:endonuclease G
MAPFEDVNHDQTAAIESMMLTNIVPQHSGNNRGIWRVLEDRVRNMSLEGDIFVITGPVFDQPRTPIGDNAIPVPSKLYKIVINAKTKTVTTYLVPNESVSSSLLPTLVTDIATVSKLTGINFLPILDLVETK